MNNQASFVNHLKHILEKTLFTKNDFLEIEFLECFEPDQTQNIQRFFNYRYF